MEDGLLTEVREACRAVAERARFVRVDRERIRSYAASLPLDGAGEPVLDAAHHYLGEPEATIAFILTLDAINFGSGYFPFLRKRAGLSGYFTVATSLKDRFERAGAFGAADLARLTGSDCATMLGQKMDGGPVEELMGLFARALNDLGRWLGDRFDGRFDGPVAAADGSAERLVRLLAEMPFFRDVEEYDGLDVSFYKRAQLTTADLALTFAGKGWGRFRDLDRLTIFADNLVPHVLRVDGVLRYDAELASRIDGGVVIEAGSQRRWRSGRGPCTRLSCWWRRCGWTICCGTGGRRRRTRRVRGTGRGRCSTEGASRTKDIEGTAKARRRASGPFRGGSA
jgi:hypothetical protein